MTQFQGGGSPPPPPPPYPTPGRQYPPPPPPAPRDHRARNILLGLVGGVLILCFGAALGAGDRTSAPAPAPAPPAPSAEEQAAERARQRQEQKEAAAAAKKRARQQATERSCSTFVTAASTNDHSEWYSEMLVVTGNSSDYDGEYVDRIERARSIVLNGETSRAPAAGQAIAAYCAKHYPETMG